MIDRRSLELTMIEIARKNGEPLDRHTLFTIRNTVAQALQAKARYKRRMTSPEFKWQKPSRKRLSSLKG